MVKKITFIILLLFFQVDYMNGEEVLDVNDNVYKNDQHRTINVTSTKNAWPWWLYRKKGTGRDKHGRARQVTWSWDDIGKLFKFNISFKSVDYVGKRDELDESGKTDGNFIQRSEAMGSFYSAPY